MPLRTAAKLALYMQKPYLKEDVSAAVGLVCFANWVWIGFEDQRHALDEVEVEDRMRAAQSCSIYRGYFVDVVTMRARLGFGHGGSKAGCSQQCYSWVAAHADGPCSRLSLPTLDHHLPPRLLLDNPNVLAQSIPDAYRHPSAYRSICDILDPSPHILAHTACHPATLRHLLSSSGRPATAYNFPELIYFSTRTTRH